MELKTIHIEVGNDALLRFLPKYQDGEAVCPEAIDDLVVETGFNGSMTEVPHTIQDGRICFPISADQTIGTYDIRLTGTIAGQHKRTTYQRVYARCANSSGIHGRTIAYDYDLLLVGSSSAELEAAVAAAEAERDHLATATAAADAARTEYEQKVMKIDNLARKEDIPTDYARKADIPADLARKGDLPTNYARRSDIPTDYARAGKVAKTLDDIKVDIPSDLARTGEYNQQFADLTAKIGGIAMMTSAEYAPALADLDSKLV